MRQARGHFVQGDLDLAEKEAKDADALKVEFTKNEDSPTRILADVNSARTDAKGLLKAARAAYQRKDYDTAEKYARLSDKASSTWAMTLWGDTPLKVYNDIQAARAAARASKARAKPAAKPEMPRRMSEPADRQASSRRRRLLRPGAGDSQEHRGSAGSLFKARKAMEAGDYAKAHKLIDQARD